MAMPASDDPTRPDRLHLPQVTLCAVTSVNVAATVRALEACLDQIAFAECLLLTDADVQPAHSEIRVVPIDRLGSSAAYSEFLLSRLVDHVRTSHCLVAQWDGHVLDAARWRPEFLDYDYIGASWPQFDDGHDVGNGGFSLRSRRLMEACRAPQFRPIHPEDLAIGRTNRAWLEGQGLRFAPRELADSFAAERAGDVQATLGYHGAWLMPKAIGVDAFWHVYRGLDDRSTIRVDFLRILKDVSRERGRSPRIIRLLADHVSSRRRKAVEDAQSSVRMPRR
ncbi:hypothetical protein HNO88_003939 [Novosphingobium chloroacetimidivorans]|uniref:DUF5672 domain-containing protein n=1 Tax=Novosphingobium chloroacetimidivorans TaxID=1428314 RepID=A0A7W7KDR4_9SPHN|nr:DUF5672 family protein [Novosphingobium chloroacetimidivorans]MBB4860595.1 hypothetical protein [Novosphingobium chloroacetimidivorans]